MNTIAVSSPALAAIQAAINTAVSGDTIKIPAGGNHVL